MAALLDQFGRPIRRSELRKEKSAPRRAGRRSIVSTRSFPRDVTPRRLAGILREAETPGYGAEERYLELAEIMEERDLHYFGELQTRKRQVSQIGVVIEPADDSAEALKDAELVQPFFKRQTIAAELVDVMDAVGKGFSVSEIEWDVSEGQWMPAQLHYRLPQWFTFDPDTGSRLLLRDDEGGFSELDAYKYVVHLSKAKAGLAVRGGLARIAAWGWMGKHYTMQDWLRFAEAYGQPIRVGKYPVNADPDDLDVLYGAVRDIAADAAAIIPDSMTIEFEGADNPQGRSDIYRDNIRYVDSKISIAVLGQTLTAQEGESGSYALGEVHNLVRHDIETADADMLAATLQRDIVIPTVRLNRGERDVYPRVVIRRETPVDLKLTVEALDKLVPLGLDVGTDEVRGRLGFQKPGDHDEVLQARQSPNMDPREEEEAQARARAEREAEDRPESLPPTEAVADAMDPLTGAWVERLRGFVDGAGSLPDLADTLGREGIHGLDADDAAEMLGLALVAALLAGRYDAGAEHVALAADEGGARLRFNEQIEFFRRKLSLPTATWSDIWQSQHDVAFVVAGAQRTALVSDFHGAVEAAIADGQTLETFRKDFDDIVKRHGWSYKGARGWRTRVIYETNLRTSYAAGRWQQIQATKATRPYMRYRHSHASENPRNQHVRWDKLILKVDDPWWLTHFPPNGWGCKCYSESLSERDLQRLGKKGPDTAPALDMQEVVVSPGKRSERRVSVPAGIDPGFAYAPGREAAAGRAVRHSLLASIAQEPGIAADGISLVLARPGVMDAHLAAFAQWRRGGGRQDRAEAFRLGVIPTDAQRELFNRESVKLDSAVVTVTRGELAHTGRPAKIERGTALDDVDLDRLPEIVGQPEAVLLDTRPDAADTLLFVFSPEAEAVRKGKVVVRVNFHQFLKTGSGPARKVFGNSVRSAGYVAAADIRVAQYLPLFGEVK